MEIKEELAEKIVLCGIYLGLLGALIQGKANEEDLPPVRTQVIQLDDETNPDALNIASPVIQDKPKTRILK